MRTPILVIAAIAVAALGAVWWSASREPAEEVPGAAAEGGEPGEGKRRKGLAVEARPNPRHPTKNVKVSDIAPAAAEAAKTDVPSENE